MVTRLNSTSPISLDQKTFRIKDIVGKETRVLPQSDYYRSTLLSLAEIKEEEDIELEPQPIAPPEAAKKTDSTVLGKVYDYVSWFVGLFYKPETKPVPVFKIASQEQEDEEEKPKNPSRPIAPCPKLQAPDIFEGHALQKTMAAVDHLLYQIKETNEDGHEHTKEDPNGSKAMPRALFQPIETKQDLAGQNESGADSDQRKEERDLNAEEAYLYKEFMQLLLTQKDLSQEDLRILTKLVSISVRTNKELEKQYFDTWNDKNSRNKILKIFKWAEGFFSGCLIAGTVAGVVLTIASAGTALIVIAGALQAGVSLSKGSVEILQAILHHKNQKLFSEMYGISLERYQNTKQIELHIRGLQDSLNHVKNSWGELVKLLRQRQRALKIEV